MIPIQLLLITDIHGRTEHLGEILSHRHDLVIVAGDFTHFGGVPEMEEILKFFDPEKTLAIPGNCDTPQALAALERFGISIHGKNREFGGFNFFGIGGSIKTPWGTPFELPEERIEQMLKEAKTENLILVTHSPPYNTKVDDIGGGKHIGSLAIRAFIDKNQPILCVCGHAHEGKGRDTIGKTTVINPGPAKNGFFDVFEI